MISRIESTPAARILKLLHQLHKTTKSFFYDFSIVFNGTIRSLRSATLDFRPAEKHVLPTPNVSPSSKLCGIGWSIVSGKNITQKPEASATIPNITAGTFGSKLSVIERMVQSSSQFKNKKDLEIPNNVIRGVKAPDRRADIDPRPIAEFRTTKQKK